MGGLEDGTACVSSAVPPTTTLVFGGRLVPPRLSLLPGILRVCVEFLRLMASRAKIVVSSLKDNSGMAVGLLT